VKEARKFRLARVPSSLSPGRLYATLNLLRRVECQDAKAD